MNICALLVLVYLVGSAGIVIMKSCNQKTRYILYGLQQYVLFLHAL